MKAQIKHSIWGIPIVSLYPSLGAAMQKEVSSKEFYTMENWQDFLSLSQLSGNSDIMPETF